MKGEYSVNPCALDHFRRWCSSTWWGLHILCAVHAVVISGKNPLYDCVGWFIFTARTCCGFLNASHSFNVFLILVFQFLGWKKKYRIHNWNAGRSLHLAGRGTKLPISGLSRKMREGWSPYRDRDASTAPTTQNAPDTRESWRLFTRGAASARATVPGRTLPQKPKWRHTSALYTETRAGTILSSSITGSELY